MAYRGKMDRGHSRKVFTGAAKRVHPRNNMLSRPMRGGIRL